jgi:hypothetical protein
MAPQVQTDVQYLFIHKLVIGAVEALLAKGLPSAPLLKAPQVASERATLPTEQTQVEVGMPGFGFGSERSGFNVTGGCSP